MLGSFIETMIFQLLCQACQKVSLSDRQRNILTKLGAAFSKAFSSFEWQEVLSLLTSVAVFIIQW
jgi:hypothetical protein